MKKIYAIKKGLNVQYGTYLTEKAAEQFLELLKVDDHTINDMKIVPDWILEEGDYEYFNQNRFITVTINYTKSQLRNQGPIIQVREAPKNGFSMRCQLWKQYIYPQVTINQEFTGFIVYCKFMATKTESDEDCIERAKLLWKTHKNNSILVTSFYNWLISQGQETKETFIEFCNKGVVVNDKEFASI